MASTASLPAYLLPGVPVHQPSHLEGNPSLATEILPGPPPLVSAQQATQKRDPKKPSISFSYLPPSDPGSTYSGLMHGTLVGQELTAEASRSKRARLDKSSTTGRAQRASARQQNSAPPVTMDLTAQSDEPASNTLGLGDAEILDSVIADDDLTPSRSTSTHNASDSVSLGRGKRKDKGKAKEVESAQVRVKEEPKAVSLLTPEPSGSALNNNDDHCSSCRSQGALVYCDGCPRAFHLWCLDPPVEQIDEGDSRWFCPSCMIKKHPPRRPPPSLLSPLIHHLENSIPTEFQLPDDLRGFFKDVTTGPKGAYVDASELKQPRLNRHGQLEDRDVYRLRDRNGTPVLCYRCGTSALPTGAAAIAPFSKRPRRASAKISTDAWKGIISCDFCNLHWHLDCLDPPLSAMPPFNRKWMCPNHAEQILPSKRRIPKQNALPIEISQPLQFNNGNIEVTHPEASSLPMSNKKLVVDEVLINGRRYRVPERVIVFDFWNKISQVGRGPAQ
ncbi:hypothetical protein BDN72DRAFT_318483 [Pluteus cervinus]|uniref:Uncharacterized protein n=1 Tax=Pluteus cervinus TaxID=181527 RepID=A0ACD3B4J5_9AGAR|nr:hypothetical protein BDN72DRAFT_318483 [Pluteus cervinus]